MKTLKFKHELNLTLEQREMGVIVTNDDNGSSRYFSEATVTEVALWLTHNRSVHRLFK